MTYIKNSLFKEIKKASEDGDSKASEIINGLLSNNMDQEHLNSLIDEYYSSKYPKNEEIKIITKTEPEVELTDLVRSQKNADYFKAYDPESRQKFIDDKSKYYKDKFNTRLNQIEKQYSDMNKSLDMYSDKVNNLVNDDVELDMNNVSNAYNDLINSENMNTFNRYWDEEDVNNNTDYLKNLVSTYGKNNVISSLNELKSDNENYKEYLKNQIDNEIKRFITSIENLLK